MYALGGEFGLKGVVPAAGGRGAELDMAGYCKQKQSPAGARCCSRGNPNPGACRRNQVQAKIQTRSTNSS